MTTAGRAYVTTGKLDKGIEALEAVSRNQPYNLNAHFILGSAYANAGQTEKALAAFRKVLKITPFFSEAKKIIVSIKAFGKVKVNLR